MKKRLNTYMCVYVCIHTHINMHVYTDIDIKSIFRPIFENKIFSKF